MSKQIKNKDYLFQDYPEEFIITEKMKNNIINNLKMRSGLPYRLAAGLFYTDEEIEEYFATSLKRPLPANDTIQRKRRLFK